MTSAHSSNALPGKAACTRLFWLAAGLHLVFWTLIPTLTSPNAPLDVIEGYAWGREWLIGTYKHPPMQAWILELFAVLTGRAVWAHFLASQVAVIVAFWAVWRTGLRMTGPVQALLGALLLEGIAYYNFTSPEFNPNVLQLPFWALACWSFHRSVTENRWFDWAALGVWAAGGLYSKYSMGILLVVLAGLLLGHPDARRRLRGPGPYAAFGLALLLFMPHFLWLVAHAFQPLGYAESRTAQAVHFLQRLTQPLGFTAAQVLSLLAMLLLFAVTAWGRIGWNRDALAKTSFNHFFLHAVTFGPLMIILGASIIIGFRPRDMWGSCLWNFIGLWLMVFVATGIDAASLKRFWRGWFFVFILALAVLAASNLFYPYVRKNTLRIHFPGKPLAEAVTGAWRERYQRPMADRSSPLVYIIGDTWLAGNVAYYAGGLSGMMRPHIVIVPGIATSPWALPEDIWSKGGILLWCSDKCRHNVDLYSIPSYLKWRFPGAILQKPLTFPYQTKQDLEPATVGWAILPPASSWPEKDVKPSIVYPRYIHFSAPGNDQNSG